MEEHCAMALISGIFLEPFSRKLLLFFFFPVGLFPSMFFMFTLIFPNCGGFLPPRRPRTAFDLFSHFAHLPFVEEQNPFVFSSGTVGRLCLPAGYYIQMGDPAPWIQSDSFFVRSPSRPFLFALEHVMQAPLERLFWPTVPPCLDYPSLRPMMKLDKVLCVFGCRPRLRGPCP